MPKVGVPVRESESERGRERLCRRRTRERERERERGREKGRERESERECGSFAVAILAQVDLPLPFGGALEDGPSGVPSIPRRVDAPSSGGRLEPHIRCHLASVALAGTIEESHRRAGQDRTTTSLEGSSTLQDLLPRLPIRGGDALLHQRLFRFRGRADQGELPRWTRDAV